MGWLKSSSALSLPALHSEKEASRSFSGLFSRVAKGFRVLRVGKVEGIVVQKG